MNKTATYVIGTIVVLAVIGYFTNWFGLGKKKTTTPTGTGASTGSAAAGSSGRIASQNGIIVTQKSNCVTSGTRTCCRPGGPAPTASECEALSL